jgi:hypothetical protein
MMTGKLYKCWYDDNEEDDDPVSIAASDPRGAAEQFIERDWEGGAEWYFVMVRDGEDVSRWKVTVETTTEFTARRSKEKT